MADIDARFSVFVAAKGLRATVDYYPAEGNGKSPAPEAILEKLREMGINTGIKQDVIASLSGCKRQLKSVVIAEAVLPCDGVNAHIEQYINLSSKKGLEREDGSVDFYNLGDICSVSKGQEMFRKIPPTVGKPGMDIMGKEIPGMIGRDIRVVLGAGTVFDPEDPNLVRADRDGEIVVKNGVLHITEIHTVKDDVDFSTGNIRFKGTVKVSGTVRSGFSIEAGGDVEIGKNVEDAIVTAGNDIIIMGGLLGSGQGLVRAGRDVMVKFVENQSIEADRDIIIKDASYHAVLSAGRSILVKSGKGTIVGGQAKATHSVEALRFGSAAGVPTVIRIGVNPKLIEKMKLVEEEITRSKESAEKIEQSIMFLNRQKIDGKRYLSPEKAELLQKLEEAQKGIPEKMENLLKEQEQLLMQQGDINKGYASVDVNAYPQVRIFIGNQFLAVEDRLDSSIFKRIKGEMIRSSKLNPPF